MIALLMLASAAFAGQQCLEHGACAAQCAASLRVCIADCSPTPPEEPAEERDLTEMFHTREVITEVLENIFLPPEEIVQRRRSIHDIKSAAEVRSILATLQYNSSEEMAFSLHWSSIDTNGDNIITGEEVVVTLRDMASTMSDLELMALVELSDLDADGMVTFEEMKAQIGARLVWFALDFNKDDKFTLEELHRFADEMGETFTESELENHFEETDADDNGEVSYEEFLSATASEIPEIW